MCTEKGCSEVSVRENQPGILERKNEHKGKTKSTIFAKKARKGDTRGRRMFHAEGTRREGRSGTFLGAQINSAKKETGAYHKGFVHHCQVHELPCRITQTLQGSERI